MPRGRGQPAVRPTAGRHHLRAVTAGLAQSGIQPPRARATKSQGELAELPQRLGALGGPVPKVGAEAVRHRVDAEVPQQPQQVQGVPVGAERGSPTHAADAQGGNQVRRGAAREILRGSTETRPRLRRPVKPNPVGSFATTEEDRRRPNEIAGVDRRRGRWAPCADVRTALAVPDPNPVRGRLAKLRIWLSRLVGEACRSSTPTPL